MPQNALTALWEVKKAELRLITILPLGTDWSAVCWPNWSLSITKLGYGTVAFLVISDATLN
jgi:hypothetical protein